jgi:GNAT superfamily N-acetyltransferase
MKRWQKSKNAFGTSMPTLRQILDGLTANGNDSENWIELVRDLSEPISMAPPEIEFSKRWAQNEDILAIAALEGFVKEIDFMTRALEKGDICLLFERNNEICAFAWVTFRDYRLDLWHTLHLLPGYAYLVYIFVRPEFQRRGVGFFLLGSLMGHLREMGCKQLISGMYADWRISIGLHRKAGFRVNKKFIKRRLLRFLPFPPKKVEFET